MSQRWITALFAFFASAAPVAAQNAIPLRSLTPAVQTDSGTLKTALSIRPLSDGRVLVNDNSTRRLLLFDATLKKYTVVLDSAVNNTNHYAINGMDLTPWLGDSTLLLDVNAQAYMVVSPDGNLGRTMAPPLTGSVIALLGLFGNSTRGIDPQGRVLYARPRSSPPRSPQLAANPPDSGTTTVTVTHDSSVVMRVDFDTRQLDTVATFARPTAKSIEMALGRGGMAGGSGVNPFPLPDEWAPLPDGTVAIVRGRDYHIDWIHPDGSRTSTPKMAFDWKRVPEEEKQRMTDSLRTAAEQRYAQPPAVSTLGGISRTFPKVPPVWFEPKDMEDYYPPIRTGTVKSDPEGNVWILPTTSVLAGKGLVYDLVNRKGEVFERVRLPEGRTLVAVGKGGVVYMSYIPTRGVAYLERAVIVR